MNWDPSILFKDQEAWEEEFKSVAKEIKTLKKYRGKRQVKQCLEDVDKYILKLRRLSAYSSRLRDTDMANSTTQGMCDRVEKLFSEFGAATSFVEPELVDLISRSFVGRVTEKHIKKFVKEYNIKDQDRNLLKLMESADHLLSDEEEALLSRVSAFGSNSYNVYSTFTNAELVFPEIDLPDGEKVRLSNAMYRKYGASQNRDLRREVFTKFWKTYDQYKCSFSKMLSTQIAYYDFKSKARGYKNSLEKAMEEGDLPVEFYPNLISSVKTHLPVFHDYLGLRKELLGLDKQYYYDIYPELVETKGKTYTYKQAQRIIPRALKPLGHGYCRVLRKALRDDSGWVDVYPKRGKRSGAYSSSVYGKHPLVLMNYTDDFDSLSTTAHELGHALHSHYSMNTQPFTKASYTLFTAEIASITNEVLLIDYLLENTEDLEQRKFLLAHYLELARSTMFRQTMFAEFEQTIYNKFEKGQALTAELLNKTYLKLLREYHGHKDGAMIIDPLYSIEWAYVPHFYYNFYVFQYVSGFIAANALVEMIMQEKPAAAKRYIKYLLKAGGSKDPLDIIKDAGVDMQSSTPYDLAANKFKARIDELRKLSQG